MSYRDALEHGQNNVGLGMVPCRPNCRCSECTIERLRARVAELEAENRLYSESLANATQEIERLLEALQSMYDAYEGVYDMAVPTPHQSDGAKLAETLARAALEGK